MSEIKVNSIKGVGASVAALSINNTDGTCIANITNNLSNRNLIINGAMQVAQRGTSSTNSGYGSVDRWQVANGNTDEAPTHSQVDVASGTTPYSLGFRKALRATNGNQTSGAGASDFIFMFQKFEAQNIANSGWNYTSTSSFITLSFWVKSSVAQNFYGYIKAEDATYVYPFETGSLSADTWTKVTKTISGNSNLVFNNDVGNGMVLLLSPFTGGTYTDSGVSLNTWAAYASGTRMPDNTSTWYTTNDATFEITGVQLEVSDHATDFEHLSFADELRRCQRYYVQYDSTEAVYSRFGIGISNSTTQVSVRIEFPVPMRAVPTFSATATLAVSTGAAGYTVTSVGLQTSTTTRNAGQILASVSSGLTTHKAYYLESANNNTSNVKFSAEL